MTQVHVEKPKLFPGRRIHRLARANSQSRDLALKKRLLNLPREIAGVLTPKQSLPVRVFFVQSEAPTLAKVSEITSLKLEEPTQKPTVLVEVAST